MKTPTFPIFPILQVLDSDRLSFFLFLAVVVLSPITVRSQEISSAGSWQHVLSQTSAKQSILLSDADWILRSGVRFPSDSLTASWSVNSLKADYTSHSNKTTVQIRSETRSLTVDYSRWFSMGHLTASVNHIRGYGTQVTGGGLKAGVPLGWFGDWTFHAERRPWLYEQRFTISDSRAVFTQGGADEVSGISLTDLNIRGIHLRADWETGRRFPFGNQDLFQDKGTYRFRKISAGLAGLQAGNRWSVLVSSFSQTGHPDLEWKDTGFSEIPDELFETWSAGFSISRSLNENWSGSLIGTFEKFDLKAAGYLQSFPFANGAVAFLGDYFFFDVRASYQLAGLLGEANWSPSGTWSVGIRSGYTWFKPELETETWQPIAFLLGRRNEKQSRLSWKALHLVPVRIRLEKEGKWGFFAIQVHQWIPVYLEKQAGKGTSGTSGGGSSGGAPKKSDSGSSGWGGTTIQVSWGVFPSWYW